MQSARILKISEEVRNGSIKALHAFVSDCYINVRHKSKWIMK